MKKTYPICEYQSFVAEKNVSGYKSLPSQVFLALETFIEQNHNEKTDALDLMSVSWKKGIGKLITAKNYVGIIALKDGSTIEILPKIYSAIEDDSAGTRVKKLVLNMLKTLKDTPFHTLQNANMDIAKLDVFEIFIRMFVEDVFHIAKRGLKHSYTHIEENTNFLKGKIKFSEQIKYNFAHAERNYIEYDVFSENRPENKLLKTTLLYLYKCTASAQNKSYLKTALSFFEEVQLSTNYRHDFEKCIADRSMVDYKAALQWCRVFLQGKSFTAYQGSEISTALLFSMESLFESYVATLLKRKIDVHEFNVSVQDKTYCLFDKPEKRFQIRPDIVITRKEDGAVFVLDTKWKLLSSDKTNNGIAQSDMYQMYAYQKKYQAEKIVLIYPKTQFHIEKSKTEYSSQDGVHVQVQFIDLFDTNEFFDDIYNIIKYDNKKEQE